VHWLRPPPYLRWLGAALVLVAAAWLEIGPRPEVLRPFVVAATPAGTLLAEDQVEWRPVPAGVLAEVEVQGVTLVDLPPGAPLIPEVLAPEAIEAPPGWWALEMPLPGAAVPGGAVRLVLLPRPEGDGAPKLVKGEVLSATGSADPLLSGEPTGLVAVPSEMAVEAAAAVAEGRAVILLGGALAP
jgi:hypothetical protein